LMPSLVWLPGSWTLRWSSEVDPRSGGVEVINVPDKEIHFRLRVAGRREFRIIRAVPPVGPSQEILTQQGYLP
jgi:hypothetical protein